MNLVFRNLPLCSTHLFPICSQLECSSLRWHVKITEGGLGYYDVQRLLPALIHRDTGF